MAPKIKVLQLAAVDVTVRFQLLSLIDHLLREKYDVHIACSPGKYADELAKRGYKIQRIEIVRKIDLFSNLKSLWHLCRLMRQERFDIVHVHTPMAAVLGQVAAKLTRIPIIVNTAHGFYFHDLMPSWKRRPIIWVARLVGRYCTDMLFLQSSEDMATAIKEKIVAATKVLWIGNGINLSLFDTKKDDSTLRTKLKLSKADKVISFIGRLVHEKGIEDLLQALPIIIAQIPQAKLLLIGETFDSERDQKTKQRLVQMIQEHRLGSAVSFAGFREDIPELLSVINLFALPSYREGMPRTIIEAIAAGKPVVATDIRGCREEVVHGVNGLLVPVSNPPALARAIIQILSDEKLAQHMGEAGRKRAQMEFGETLVLSKQSKAYERLLAERNGNT